MFKSATRPNLPLLLAVGLVSAAVLGFEVSLTRVFAVLLRYHFAFLVVSIAVCGLGVGGFAAFWARRRWSELPLCELTIAFAASVAIALALMLRGVFAFYPEAFWVAAALVLVPFSLAGAFLAEAFARFPLSSGKLYAWDLAGASLMALAVVGLLQFVSAIDACLLMGALAAGGGVLVATQKRLHGVIATVALLVLTGINAKTKLLDIPPIPPKLDAQKLSLADKGTTQPLFTELGTPGHTSRIVETRWSAFARTDVVKDSAMPGSYYLYTNGNVPTNMMAWNGKLDSIDPIAGLFPLSDWAFSVAPFAGKTGEPASERGVLSIGPGGGLDALLALHHGAAEFDGAEINPSIVQLMNEPKYAKFNGGIYMRDDVKVHVADGRAFVRESIAQHKKYALLFSALTKTATAGQGMALLESYIYTTDAFSDYLDVLRPDGQITIVLDNPFLTARFFVTALQVFKSRGINEKEACQHIAIVHAPQPGQPYVFAIVVQKTPFTKAQTYRLLNQALRRSLRPLWIPNQAEVYDYGPYPAVGKGKMDLAGFLQTFRNFETPLDISACPDNRPFVLDLSLGVLPLFRDLTLFTIVLTALLLGVSWTVSSRTAIAEPEAEKTKSLGADGLFIFYFLALGAGFMLVEIPLIQKLILPLGYPTLSLTVILFSILLGGGVGSWFAQRFEGKTLVNWAIVCALVVAAYAAIGVLALPRLTDLLLPMAIEQRCVLAVLLLLPLGFFIGAPFPSGLRMFANGREEKIPLVWGLNGIASVVGSLASAMGAKQWGFAAMLTCGAVIYVAAAACLFMIGKVHRPQP